MTLMTELTNVNKKMKVEIYEMDSDQKKLNAGKEYILDFHDGRHDFLSIQDIEIIHKETERILKERQLQSDEKKIQKPKKKYLKRRSKHNA